MVASPLLSSIIRGIQLTGNEAANKYGQPQKQSPDACFGTNVAAPAAHISMRLRGFRFLLLHGKSTLPSAPHIQTSRLHEH